MKAPVILSLASQISSYIELTITTVPSVIDKKNNFVLCSGNSIQNDLSNTNNDNIQFCETQRKSKSIPTTSTPNHHAQRIAATSANMLNLQTTTKWPPVNK